MAFSIKKHGGASGDGDSGSDRVKGNRTLPIPGNGHGHSHSDSSRLSVIMENGDAGPASAPPSKPPNASHRPHSRRFQHGDPPGHEHDRPPPPYSPFANVIGPRGEKLLDVRNNVHLARRGGWRRLCTIGLILVVIIVGLTVGLVVGLRERNKSSPAPPAPSPSEVESPDGPFPIGSYKITTFLSTETSNCTSNPSTWKCFPYATIAQSATASTAFFNWIIVANDSSPSKFSISSSTNPFALSFSNIPLELRNKGLESEHYSFSVPMDKEVPNVEVTDDGSLATCYYNGTTLAADLYSKQPQSFPASPSSSSSSAASAASPSTSSGASEEFRPYPFAVEVKQSISGGANVPTCFKTNRGQPVGDRITEGVSERDGQCSCLYQNYGP
ncbi:MAG: hypothetical protein M1837_000704 [Sclerophora amabilis]|nr:MAG: hypothetical protein M1837_000704 [Sclerophora amabilis]